MIASTTRSELVRCLNEVDFPAAKEDLLAIATRTGCDDDIIGALQGLTPRTYTNGKQVLASISVVDDGDIPGDGEETAGSRRSHTEPDRDGAGAG